MLNTDKKSCRILSSLLTKHGVCDVIISPGSRNTPLILAVDANGEIRKRVVIDERSAAFIALGLALSSKKPVALICTSGTALLNYAPAVAEAYYQGVPLIIISADRPMQWIDQDDSQTLRQFEALSNFVKKSYDIPDFDETDEEMSWYANRVINDALITATDRRNGPVHINIQLNQPLSKLNNYPEFENQRQIKSIKTLDSIPQSYINELSELVSRSKVLIIGGFVNRNDLLTESLCKLSNHSNIAVLTESITNVGGRPDNKIISTIDRVISPLNEKELLSLSPDVVISFGGALVSRYVKQFLRDNPSKRHISVGYTHTTVDCFKTLSEHIEIEPAKLFSALSDSLNNSELHDMQYSMLWSKYDELADMTHERFINASPWSDLKAFSIIAEVLKGYNNDISIALSNGTPIRYFQLFKGVEYNNCWCNRGVSGIDGCTSTSIGLAVGNTTDTLLLISGDMSFSYDIGALATKFVTDNFKVIVLNNSGGGIFRFIPSTASLTKVEDYFAVQPVLPIEELANAYDFVYFSADDEHKLLNSLPEFLNCKSKAILNIVTPPEVSGKILRDYMKRK